MLLRLEEHIRQSPRLSDILTPERNSFAVLRLLMASLVLVSHSYLYLYATSQAEPLTSLIGWSLGECAVQVFFFMSGVMVAQSFDRSRSVVDFAVARALRIFPALIVCVLITALLIGPVVSHMPLHDYFANPQFFAYIAKTIALATGSAPLPGVFDSVPYANYVNSSLWTLKYEVLCYVGLAALGAAGLFKPVARVFAAAGLAAMIAFVFVVRPDDPEQYRFFDNIRYFAVFFGSGVFAYILRDKLVISALVLLPLLALFVLMNGTPFAEASAALLLGYGALVAATFTFGPMRAFCNRIDMSYGTYIFAGPIQQLLIWLVPGIAPCTLTALAGAIVFPIALVSWIVIERPALGLRRRLVSLLQPKRSAPVT